jgi:hypothetical protein
MGKPDLVLVGKKINEKRNVWIPIEFKSTQNLLVPFEKEGIVTRYNTAVTNMSALAEQLTEAQKANDDIYRTKEWSNIAHPVGQLFGYMGANQSRYGVLSSGTRTYFMYVNDEGSPLISDAWLVGKVNYLRAWCYFFKIAHAAEESRDGSDGVALGDNNQHDAGVGNGSGPSESNKRICTGDSGSSTEGSQGKAVSRTTAFTTSPSSTIPVINCEDFELLDQIGHGNNQVYLALWKNQKIAVKVFDIYKDYEWFEKEVRAYDHLQAVWGILVPKPHFISNMSGAVALLGMQLGRDPNSDDKGFAEEHACLFSKLLQDHDFDHLDTDRGNVIYIPDDQGKERLVAMDLEHHEILGRDRQR